MKPNPMLRDILLSLIFGTFFITVFALIRYDLIYPPTSPYNTPQVQTEWK